MTREDLKQLTTKEDLLNLYKMIKSDILDLMKHNVPRIRTVAESKPAKANTRLISINIQK